MRVSVSVHGDLRICPDLLAVSVSVALVPGLRKGDQKRFVIRT